MIFLYRRKLNQIERVKGNDGENFIRSDRRGFSSILRDVKVKAGRNVIGMEPVLMEDLERYCFLSELTGNHNVDHPVYVCVVGRMDKEANRYRYTLKMQKSGEWRTVCELDKPGVLLFLDADTLLLSGVKSTDAPVQPDSVPTRFSTFSCSAEEWKETFTLPLKT